jgi:hypothetical protein
LPGTANYFLGSDPAKWHTHVPTYAKVKYAGIYPGIDLVYYGKQGRLEYDFVVAPAADPKPVRLHFGGTEGLKLSSEGDLIVRAKHGEIAFHKPGVYQMKDGQRQPVEGRFRLLANNNVGFVVGRYDHSRELVIDPSLVYSTYLGNITGPGGAYGSAIAVDSAGDAYVTGTANSGFSVTSGSFQTVDPAGYVAAFITKFNPSGTALVYSTYLGDNTGGPGGATSANAIAVDSEGDAYVTGATAAYFPTTSGAYQTVYKGAASGTTNAFVTKLNSEGSALIYSTYLGGEGLVNYGGDTGYGITFDASGNAYITGGTYSSDFPVTGNAFQKANKAAKGGSNAFVAKLNPTGSSLVYSTYLGGTKSDQARAIAIDDYGFAFVTGAAFSEDFPVTANAFQKVNNGYAVGVSNAFVAKLTSSGSALDYSTYLGGNGSYNGPRKGDSGAGIAIDVSGNAYITGSAGSTDFPVTSGALQKTNKGAGGDATNAFVTKLNPAGAALVYSTYLGGTYPSRQSGGDTGAGIAVDTAGDAYVTGSTGADNFPITSNAYQSSDFAAFGISNAFVTELNPAGSALIYSTYLGGSWTDEGRGIAVSANRNIYVTGSTTSLDFPLSDPLQSFNDTSESYPGTPVAFVSRIAFPTSASSITLNIDGPNPPEAGTSIFLVATVSPESHPAGWVRFAAGTNQLYENFTSSGGNTTSANFTLPEGKQTIVATYSGDDNYAQSSTTLTVRPYGGATSMAAVSGSGQSGDYGHPFAKPLVVIATDSEGDPVPGVSVSWQGSGLTFSTTNTTTGANGEASVTVTPTSVGALTAQAVGAGTVPFTLTAVKAPLTVTATSIEVAYGQPIPALTYNVTGFVNGDKSSVVTGAPTETTTAKKGSPVGTYPIVLGQGTLAATNYSFTLVNGTVKITE